MRSALVLAITGACADTTPPWDLGHDRVIGVRATPPALAPGQSATIDALVAVGSVVMETSPVTAELDARTAAVADLRRDGDAWVVTARSDDDVAAARSELGLAAGTPVPVTLSLVFALDGVDKLASKAVSIGAERANPIAEISIEGAPRADQVTVDLGRDIALVTEASDTDEIDWLTSLGELTDDDDPIGYLRVDEPATGILVVVRRDGLGGIGWDVVAVEAR